MWVSLVVAVSQQQFLDPFWPLLDAETSFLKPGRVTTVGHVDALRVVCALCADSRVYIAFRVVCAGGEGGIRYMW